MSSVQESYVEATETMSLLSMPTPIRFSTNKMLSCVGDVGCFRFMNLVIGCVQPLPFSFTDAVEEVVLEDLILDVALSGDLL